MIFRSKKHLTWDTWMYCYGGKYYLYYLITDRSPGEGFGVAVSEDGVHFEDLGQCIGPSDKMEFYLGTGSVWKKTDFEKSGEFICNYSEWRKDALTGANVQNILFAHSRNLIDWTKYGDEKMFGIDETRYVKNELDGGRWDCIFPLRTENGYQGFFTATPKGYCGCGYAVSEDGVCWKAGRPPEFDLSEKGVKEGIEAGGVCIHNGRYYMLMGTYCNEYGIAVMVSDTPDGVYRPQKKNFALLANRSFRHAYFMRFFERGGSLYVNHHAICRQENEFSRPLTYFSPIKKVTFDEEDTLRLIWSEENDLLKGKYLSAPDFDRGFIAEGIFNCGGELVFGTENGKVGFSADLANGVITIKEDGRTAEECRKDMTFPEGKFIFLYREGLGELYIDNYFITCYTFPEEVKQVENVETCGVKFRRFVL